MLEGVVRIVWLPLDLLRLTVDAWRLTSGMLIRAPSSREQVCMYCRGGDTGRAPRPLPPGLRAYRNLWVARWMMPCVCKTVTSRRGREFFGCHQEGGYVVVSKKVPCVAVLLAVGWFILILFLLRF